jgi:hypothetical protein
MSVLFAVGPSELVDYTQPTGGLHPPDHALRVTSA